MKKSKNDIKNIVKKKQKYVPPHIEVTFIEMEEGIASGSAMAKPGNGNDQITEEWESEENTDHDVEW